MEKPSLTTRAHILSRDCWCHPKIVKVAGMKKDNLIKDAHSEDGQTQKLFG